MLDEGDDVDEANGVHANQGVGITYRDIDDTSLEDPNNQPHCLSQSFGIGIESEEIGNTAPSGEDAPLLSALEQALKNIDVTDVCEGFTRQKVLRFGSIFEPGHKAPNYWAKPKIGNSTSHSCSSEPAMVDDGDTTFLHSSNIPDDGEFTPGESGERQNLNEENQIEIDDSVGQWRFGPGAFWYDKIGLEAAEAQAPGFNLVEYCIMKRNQLESEENSTSNNEPYISPFTDLPVQTSFPDSIAESKKQERDDVTELNQSLSSFTSIDLSQVEWSGRVIWDATDLDEEKGLKSSEKNTAEILPLEERRREILKLQFATAGVVGWLPSMLTRTLADFYRHLIDEGFLRSKNERNSTLPPISKLFTEGRSNDPQLIRSDHRLSIFNCENREVLNGDWVKQIIWDSEDSRDFPPPCGLQVQDTDYSVFSDPVKKDDTLIPQHDSRNEVHRLKARLIENTRLIDGGDGIEDEELDQDDDPGGTVEPGIEGDEIGGPGSHRPSPFNLSKDDYYFPKQDNLRGVLGVGLIALQHSTPAMDLRLPFFPTFLGPARLKQLSRAPIRHYSHGPLAAPGPQPIASLTKTVRQKARQREADRQKSGGGEVFFMRTVQDLSAKDGEIILVEYSEEFPPLLSRTGMASKVRNYHRRRGERDKKSVNNLENNYKYGETVFANALRSPFLGWIPVGGSIQALENGMFRAPLYHHSLPNTDFLVIRTRQFALIRNLSDIYTVGQECPITEVPGPHSKSGTNFIRQFLMVYIYKLFLASKDNPKKVRTEDVKHAFPIFSETTLRKRLKTCADFKRTGVDSGWWVLRSDFRLPSIDEIRSMVSPEQCCAYYSFLAAESRLKNAGYGEKALFAGVVDELDDQKDDGGAQSSSIDLENRLIDDEVLCAPWNTTRAFISCMRGKCLLGLGESADPTGCGQGFSYVRISPKQLMRQQNADIQKVRRSVTGTDADLRKLPLTKAKEMLKRFGIPEPEIRRLKRWEMVDCIRTLSTERVRAGGPSSKFARLTRLSVAHFYDKFRSECQRLFELQNRILGSSEHISSDEDSSDDEEGGNLGLTSKGSGLDLGKAVERFIKAGKPEKNEDEDERKELKRLLLFEDDDEEGVGLFKKEAEKSKIMPETRGKVLKIVRTFKEDGRVFRRVEIIRNKPEVIRLYVKVRSTKNPELIRQIVPMDDDNKRDLLKERRRIKDKLRRIEKGGERFVRRGRPPGSGKKGATVAEEVGTVPGMTKTGKPKSRCGVCGGRGHMRTNRICPLWSQGESGISGDGIEGGIGGGEDMEFEEDNVAASEDLIKIDDTRILLNKHALKRQENMRKQALQVKFQGEYRGRRGDFVKRGRPRKFGPYLPPKKRLRQYLGTGGQGSQGLSSGSGLGSSADSNPEGGEGQNEGLETSCGSDGGFIIQRTIGRPKGSKKGVPPKVPKLKLGRATGAGVTGVGGSNPGEKHVKNERKGGLMTRGGKMGSLGRHSGEKRLKTSLKTHVKTSIKTHKKHEDQRKKTEAPTSSDKTGPDDSKEPVASGSGVISGAFDLDYLARPKPQLASLSAKHGQRAKEDPVVSLNSVLEQILNSARSLSQAAPFLFPVNPKNVPDYYAIIKRPMDMRTIRQKIRGNGYIGRGEFLEDLVLILENSRVYNGPMSEFTNSAQVLVKFCVDKLAEKEERLIEIEKAINPLLDDDLSAFNFILERIVESLKSIDHSWPFHQPVDRKRYRDYYSLIKTPMDLGSLGKNCKLKRYRSRLEFQNDAGLIERNALAYNSPNHPIIPIAREISAKTSAMLLEYEAALSGFEEKLGGGIGSRDMTAGLTDSGLRETGLTRDCVEEDEDKDWMSVSLSVDDIDGASGLGLSETGAGLSGEFNQKKDPFVGNLLFTLQKQKNSLEKEGGFEGEKGVLTSFRPGFLKDSGRFLSSDAEEMEETGEVVESFNTDRFFEDLTGTQSVNEVVDLNIEEDEEGGEKIEEDINKETSGVSGVAAILDKDLMLSDSDDGDKGDSDSI